MVCVADVLLPASSVAVNVRVSVAAIAVACGGFAAHFDRHLTTVVGGSGVVKINSSEHSAV